MAIILPANSRVIFRAIGVKTKNCSQIQTSNIIGVPSNCGPGELLDMMNKCRKVFT